VVGYLFTVLPEITAKSAGERILKISQHLAMLEAKTEWHLFSGHGVFYISQ